MIMNNRLKVWVKRHPKLSGLVGYGLLALALFVMSPTLYNYVFTFITGLALGFVGTSAFAFKYFSITRKSKFTWSCDICEARGGHFVTSSSDPGVVLMLTERHEEYHRYAGDD